MTGHVTHGSQSIFIEGEGLISTQLGGIRGDQPDPVTKSETPRASAAKALAADEAPPFRFSRVGPKGTPLGAAVIKKLARAMVVEGGGDGEIPAGFTYLGQFIDHDLTLDKTTVMLGEHVRPVDLVQGRSPRLDLDSLYGVGPDDDVSAKFFETDGLHLKVGTTIRVAPDGAKVGHDLPRVGKGQGQAAKRAALIPDPRNDENLIVAQTHVAMIRFHNRVADRVSTSSTPASRRFSRARKLVTMHYQWMIRHDYLPRICDPSVVDDVFANGRKLVEPGAAPTSVPTMPVEFSVAAFRLGHSMVRPTYNWNRIFSGTSGGLEYMFEFSGLGGTLGGENRLITSWVADWRRMYTFAAGGRPNLKPDSHINRARRIDTSITDPLAHLPAAVFGGSDSIGFNDLRRNLAFRNLTRAAMVSLASGQQMVTKLKQVGVNVKPLTRGQILNGDGGARLDQLTSAEKDQVARRTPLWFYILREAEVANGKLKGVGARIVAETFHRAMEGSRFSIVREPSWRPSLGRNNRTFEMTDLLLFAFAGQRDEINPLGGP
jgi:hypothetical protein